MLSKKYFIYSRNLKNKNLSLEKIKDLEVMFPIYEAMYFPYIEEASRRTSKIINESKEYDKKILEFLSNFKFYKYLGTYDYKDGSKCDFYFSKKFYYVLLYKIDRDGLYYVEALFANNLSSLYFI